MTPDLPTADILTKVRGANCLTESELQSLSTAITEAQLRRELDALDSQWENDMRKYVSLRRSKGGMEALELVSRGESVAGIIIGLGMASFGGYMIWQSLQDFKKAADSSVLLPLLIFAFLLALGTRLVITSFGQFHIVTDYEREREEYLSRRKQITDQFPKEARLPVRYCPNCLSWDRMSFSQP